MTSFSPFEMLEDTIVLYMNATSKDIEYNKPFYFILLIVVDAYG
jgi:hypothetical protein